jgi:SAM-dependent methyltransferase
MTLLSYAMNQATFPQMYERWLVGPLFWPWAQITLEEIQLSPGDHVLDVACGTGIVARLARERLGGTGSVVGVDVSPDMLAVARAVAPGIHWREGDAGGLPLREEEEFESLFANKDCSPFPISPRRWGRCTMLWPKAADLR